MELIMSLYYWVDQSVMSAVVVMRMMSYSKHFLLLN